MDLHWVDRFSFCRNGLFVAGWSRVGKVKLYPNWKEIIRKAWSIRLALLATIFSVAQAIVPIYADVLSREVFAILTAVSAIGVIIARIVFQQDV